MYSFVLASWSLSDLSLATRTHHNTYIAICRWVLEAATVDKGVLLLNGSSNLTLNALQKNTMLALNSVIVTIAVHTKFSQLWAHLQNSVICIQKNNPPYSIGAIQKSSWSQGGIKHFQDSVRVGLAMYLSSYSQYSEKLPSSLAVCHT